MRVCPMLTNVVVLDLEPGFDMLHRRRNETNCPTTSDSRNCISGVGKGGC